MARAIVISVNQANALKRLIDFGCLTATDFDRHVLESLADRGYAIKHKNGHSVTYTISGQGRAIYKSL